MAALRFGIMGCADFALRRMMPAIAATPGAMIRTVASRSIDKARAAAKTYGSGAVQGYESMLADSAIDAVYIPLPPSMHAEWAAAALMAGKHVLAEKPLSLDAATTAGLIELAESKGLIICENVLFVHHRQHKVVRDLVAKGAIGEVRDFHASFAIPERPPSDIRLQAHLGGGALWDAGVYPLRAASYFLGPGLAVQGATRLDRGDLDIAGSALLSSPSGVGATATFSIDHDYRNQYTISGSHGRIEVDRAFTPAPGFEPRVCVIRGSTVEQIPVPAMDQAVAAVSAFVSLAGRRRYMDSDVLREQAELRDAVRKAS